MNQPVSPVSPTSGVWQSWLDAAPVPLAVANGLGNVVYANPQWLQLSGKSLQTIIGAKISTLFEIPENHLAPHNLKTAHGKRVRLLHAKEASVPRILQVGVCGDDFVLGLHPAPQLRSPSMQECRICFPPFETTCGIPMLFLDATAFPRCVSGAFETHYGWSIKSLLTPEGQRALEPLMRHIHASQTMRQGYSEEFPFLTLEGKNRHIRCVPLPLDGKQGVHSGTAVFLIDETAHYRTERFYRENEERFRLLVDNIREVLWIHDVREEKIIYVSPSYEYVYGRSTASLYLDARSFLEAVHPDDRQRVENGLSKLYKQKSSLDIEFRIALPDGGQRWILSRQYPVLDAQGEVYHSVGVAEDISSRKNAEERLQKKALINKRIADITKKLIGGKSTLDSMCGLIFDLGIEATHSEQGFVAFFPDAPNGKAAVLDAKQCTVKRDTIGVNRNSDFAHLLERCIDSREPIFSNGPHQLPPLTPMPPSALASRRFIAAPAVFNEEPLGLLAVAESSRDYTALDLQLVKQLADFLAIAVYGARSRQHLQDAIIAAESASQAKSDFLANISHELRTPLNGVMGMLQLLYTTPLDQEQKNYTDTAHTSCRALLAIINDLLDLTVMESGESRILNAPFSLKKLLRSIDLLYHQQFLAKKLQFSIRYQDAPDQVIGDMNRLRQILLNLLSNALKFTASGSVTLDVIPLPETSDSITLLFCVTDTGIGITREKITCVFEQFTQAESSFSRRFGGLGLGLSIVKRLVDRMGGSIELFSEEGMGTEVHCVMRFQIPNRYPSALPSWQKIPTAPSNHATVLVVEDNQMNRTMLQRMLEKLNYGCQLAENGHKALDVLENHKIDGILMDIEMPLLNGLETTRLIRAHLNPAIRELPIIALSAHTKPDDDDPFWDAGMNSYLAKPVSIASLREILHKHIPLVEDNAAE